MPNKILSTAIILAGGFGTRLLSIQPDRPKVLVEVAGHPFLHYVLLYLLNQKITEIILSLGHLASQVIDYIGDGSSWQASISCIVEEKPLGTAGALRLSSQFLTQPFFVINGDTLFLADLDSLSQAHQEYNPLVTMALVRVKESQAKGCVLFDQTTGCQTTSSPIIQFREKPQGLGAAVVNAGVYIIHPDAISGIEPGQSASLENDVFPILASRRKIYGQIQDRYFIDIGTPPGLAAFEKDVLLSKVPGFETKQTSIPNVVQQEIKGE